MRRLRSKEYAPDLRPVPMHDRNLISRRAELCKQTTGSADCVTLILRRGFLSLFFQSVPAQGDHDLYRLMRGLI